MNPLDLNKDTEIVKSENAEMPVVVNNEDVVENANVTEIQTQAEEITPSDVVSATTETVEESNSINTETIDNVTVINASETISPALPDYNSFSKQELVVALSALIEKDIELIKDEVEIIKQSFYKKSKAEIEDQKKAFIENGGEELDFVAQKDDSEDKLKELLNSFKAKKAALTAQKEKEKEDNLLQKQHVIEQMKALVEKNDDVSIHINEFRTLQQKWKSIGHVPAQAATELWKQYNSYQEAFWDLIKINNELREYDFKKNLEAKTQLCVIAEKLDQEEDVVSAFQQLQKLHEEWHELGPVARELRDEIWNRFRDASAVINKKHQGYFDGIRKLEEENLQLKIALCEKIEAFDFSGNKTYKSWDEGTQTILAWQDEWRAIGFAPRKSNQKTYERYRNACDAYFKAKADFYKESKNQLNENLTKKTTLCEQAESLKESTDWKETTDKLIQMQKEWKSIGPIPKKISDDLWKRFIAACDYFFDKKNKTFSGQKNTESENLTKKKELIQKIEAFESKGSPAESLAALRELMAEWNTIGHVPFKEKDKIYKEYRTVVDKQFDKLNIDASQRRLDNFKNNLKDMSSQGENKLFRERDKLVRAFEHLKSEIATYENNIGFFTTSSKKGGGLIKEMERKIESLKEESKLIEQKINLIEENL